MWIEQVRISVWWENVGQQLPCRHTYHLCTTDLLSNVLTTIVFVTGVYHWLPIQLKRCWPILPSSLSLHLALLSHAATFILLSILDCTSKSTAKIHEPCMISGFCHLDDNIRAAKNHDLSALIWISVFNENTRIVMTQNKKYWNSVVYCWIPEQVTQLLHWLPK